MARRNRFIAAKSLGTDSPSSPAVYRPADLQKTRIGISGSISGVMLTLLVITSCGCASVRNRISARSEQCTELCELSRQAREQGLASDADRFLDAAMKRRPTDTQTKLELAEELWNSGRQIAAANVVADLVAEQPDDAPAALRLARMEYEIGRTAAAESALRLAMINDPENPEALRLKAELAERQGDWDTALATYHQLLQVLPDDIATQLAMASVHIRRGQSDRAAPILRGVVHHPHATLAQRHDAEWQLGLTYARAERWQDAAVCLQSAAQKGPATSDDWYRVAYAQMKGGNQEAAFASLSEALKLEPNHLAALDLTRQIKLHDHQPITAVVPVGFAPQTVENTTDTRRL
ncbi:tetratricopeptide repeat protein [bacterium]|nr:tetratricopeptide repeat protein [bacterium]